MTNAKRLFQGEANGFVKAKITPGHGDEGCWGDGMKGEPEGEPEPAIGNPGAASYMPRQMGFPFLKKRAKVSRTGWKVPLRM